MPGANSNVSDIERFFIKIQKRASYQKGLFGS